MNVSAQSSNSIYEDAQFGFSIEKPSSWSFIKSIKTAKVELNDGSESPSVVMSTRVVFQSAAQSRTGDKKTDTCLVDEIKAGNLDPLQALEKKIATSARNDKNFKLIQGPQKVVINKTPAAQASYSLLADENSQTVRRDYVSWYFLSGQHVLRFHCTSSGSHFQVANAEFNKIAQTLIVK